MRIVFFGTPIFAATNLQYLINHGHNIVAVVTPPDSIKGRGKKTTPCSVKETALLNNITVLQPRKLKDDNFINTLKELKSELFIVVAFRMLPKIVWQIPKKGTINLHTSLLPNYRGAAPINRVLINGEQETGITTFFIDQNIDSGAIIQQKEIELSNEITAAQLHDKLIHQGNNLLLSTLDSIQHDSIKGTPQRDREAILEAPKITKELLKINWEKSAAEIHNLVRGLSPVLDDNTILRNVSICPSAWFLIKDGNGNKKRIKLHLTKIIKSESKDLFSMKTDHKTYLHIITNKDAVAILHLQVEGKNPMTIQQFLQGNKITKDHQIA